MLLLGSISPLRVNTERKKEEKKRKEQNKEKKETG